MSRLDARWDNFRHRGQTWDHVWQDATTAGGPASVVGAGGIASAEAFGQPTVSAKFTVLGAGAIPSGEAFGSPSITFRASVLGAGGISSAEAIGSPSVTHLGGTTDLQGGGAWRNPPHFHPRFEPYTPFVVPMWVKVRGAGGIESAEAFGRPSVASRRAAPRRRREEELLAA